MQIIRKLPNKEQQSVKAALDKLERQGMKSKTVTVNFTVELTVTKGQSKQRFS